METSVNNKCKAFTSLEQSKKLAEILPLESADMCYIQDLLAGCKYGDYKPYIGDLLPAYGQDKIRCWSLAALLEEIPEVINFEDDENDYALEILKESGLYYLSYGNPLENGKLEIEAQENFVDACVDMIEKLHELKML